MTNSINCGEVSISLWSFEDLANRDNFFNSVHIFRFEIDVDDFEDGFVFDQLDLACYLLGAEKSGLLYSVLTLSICTFAPCSPPTTVSVILLPSFWQVPLKMVSLERLVTMA